MHYPSATGPHWCGGHRRTRRAWPQCPRVTAGYCHSPPTCTRTTQEHNTTRPTTTAPGPFGTKLSPHTPSHRMCGTKLSLLARNGSIWRFFRMQGEFCTALVSTTPSRENFVPNARRRWGSPTQQHSRHHRCEGAGGSGGIGGTTGPGRGAGGGGAWPGCRGLWRGPAALPTNDISTQPKQISHAIPPRHGSMHAQKPRNINDQTSILEIHSGELHAKLMIDSHNWVEGSGFFGPFVLRGLF